MWTIVESGIHNELLNISRKPPPGKVFKPRPVDIKGNISVQFVLHLFGLLLSLIVFIIELHKKIIAGLNSILVVSDFLVTRFLLQTQSTLLIWLKNFLTTKRNSSKRRLWKRIERNYILQGNIVHEQ